MAIVRQDGDLVVVATATQGELGTDDPDGCPPERLAPMREGELNASLEAIDVREHVWLDHRDGELAQMPPDAGAAEILDLLHAVRPDTIVTFGADGMTGHPDHQAISAGVTEAWRASGCVADLWFATVTPDFHRSGARSSPSGERSRTRASGPTPS
jgi:LmbE family N-acetylglucosaminyl deacetylase